MAWLSELDVEILLHLKARGERNISALSRELGKAYPVMYRHVKFLRDRGLVRWERKGRENVVVITPRGAKVLKSVMEVLKEIGH